QENAQVGVMPFDVSQWFDATPAAIRSRFFDDLRGSHNVVQPETQAINLRDALAAVEPGRQRRALLEEHLQEQVGRVLRLAASRIPVNKPLKGLGMDSLMALELRNRLEASLGLTLSA